MPGPVEVGRRKLYPRLGTESSALDWPSSGQSTFLIYRTGRGSGGVSVVVLPDLAAVLDGRGGDDQGGGWGGPPPAGPSVQADVGQGGGRDETAQRDFTPSEATAAITRITSGNFRLTCRLVAQIQRIPEISQLTIITREVVQAAGESLVIGIM